MKKIMTQATSIFTLMCLGLTACSTPNHQEEVSNNMDLVFTEISEVEYGTRDFDVKSLIQEVKDGEIQEYPTLD